MKKVAKKTKSTSRSKSVRKSTAPVSHSAPARKHSLSDTTLLFLSLFFVLSALFIVLMYKKQSAEFERYATTQMQRSILYAPGTGEKNMAAPKATAPVKAY